MGKLWSTTFLVTLALLGCLAGTDVEAQEWQNQGQFSNVVPHPQSERRTFSAFQPPQSPRTVYYQLDQYGDPDGPEVPSPPQPQFPSWPAATSKWSPGGFPSKAVPPQISPPKFPQTPGIYPSIKVPQTSGIYPYIKVPQTPVISPPFKVPQTPVIAPPQVSLPIKVPQTPVIAPPQVPIKVPQTPVIAPPQVPIKVPQTPVIAPPQVSLPIKVPPSTSEQQQLNCDVVQGLRVPCGVSGISANGCNAISCCFDGQQCYYGKAVTVQCTKDAQFIVVIATDATLPNIDLTSISLLGGGTGCTNVDSNSGFAIYQFPVTACGSTVTEEPGVIKYENRMSSSYEVGVGPYGAITRDSYFELIFQCRYIGSSVETVIVDVSPLQDPPLPVSALGPITVELRLGNGQCTTKGCNEVDVAYNSYYAVTDYPVTKVLRDPVYVEVQLTQKTDPNLILTLGRCWTTTNPEPHSLPQWDILINGCPYKDDRYLSSLVPVDSSSGLDFPTHYRRFIFQMFTFVDTNSATPLKQNVYIHCSTAVCTASPGISCEPICARKKRHVKEVNQNRAEPRVVVSSGLVTMASKQQTEQEVESKN